MTAIPAISALERSDAIRRLAQEVFDVVVIGGGISGAGIARDLALRGMSVALLEAHDFAAGTSSRSSKLIHGGLRYLAMGDVGLVRETALERKEVFRLAPHLAEPRWMVLPMKSRLSLVKFRVAIAAYEKLGAVEARDVHRVWSAEDLEREEPLLARDRHPHAIAYREYLTDDARLVLANLRSAVGRGAAVLNHAPVVALVSEGGRVGGVEVRCAETGERFRVRGHSVANAAGPWVEAVRNLDEPEAPEWLHLSLGVHCGVPLQRLPIRNVVMLSPGDGRTIFAIPRDGIVYLGTTDTSYSRGPEVWPVIARRDVEYLLDPIPRYFAVDPLGPDDVVTAWAGLRPLVAEPGKPAVDLSRKDEIYVGRSGLVSIAGGKLTGYRPMARNVVERLGSVLGRSLPEPEDEGPLPGGDFEGDLASLSERLQRDHGISRRVADRLTRLYGSESADVARRGADLLSTDGVEIEGEVEWAVHVEGAVTLEDALYRRLRVPLYEPLRDASLEPLARRMAALLGWDAPRLEAEIRAVRSTLAFDLDFSEDRG